MATTNVLATIFETLLCSPGMNEGVKIDVKVTRKTILLLNSIIEDSLNATAKGDGSVVSLAPPECMEELKSFSSECLKKSRAGRVEPEDQGS